MGPVLTLHITQSNTSILHDRFGRAYQILELDPETSNPKSHATLIAPPIKFNSEKYASVMISQTLKGKEDSGRRMQMTAPSTPITPVIHVFHSLPPPLLNQLRLDLDNEWPNLKNLVPKGNMKFWTNEWNKHGTCSDFAHNPVKYFDSARQIRKSLPDFGIRPGDKRKVKEVIKLVKGFTGAEPEIACNTDPQGQGGLWLQDANDSPVDPYNSGHPCVPQPPTPLTEPLLNQLRPDLDNEWPNLKNLIPKGNMKFWTDEWNKHGTCSDFAHNPVKYFDSARQIRKSLPDFGIRPGDKRKVKEVIKLVKGFTGAEPEIACNPLLNQFRPELDNEWPNLKNLVPKGNMKFWTDEWNKHGTCSDFAHNPVKYFDSARQIRKSLPDFGIRPGDKRKVKEVIKLVKGFTGAEPEIACNPDPQGQGGLVHLIRNCPFPLSHNPGGKPKGPCLNDQDWMYVP
ncbi:hypothetical protein GQ457_03G024380 [Hibiscus cannabinus]